MSFYVFSGKATIVLYVKTFSVGSFCFNFGLKNLTKDTYKRCYFLQFWKFHFVIKFHIISSIFCWYGYLQKINEIFCLYPFNLPMFVISNKARTDICWCSFNIIPRNFFWYFYDKCCDIQRDNQWNLFICKVRTYIQSAWFLFQVLCLLESLTFKKFKPRAYTCDIICKKVLIATQIPNVSWRCFIWIVSYICDSLLEFYHFVHLLLRLISVSSQQLTQINHKLKISWQCLKISRNIFHSEKDIKNFKYKLATG